MRASTLFAVTIAILLGLAAAITVKVTGYFNQPAAVAPPRGPELTVLVAGRNLFAGDLIDANWVQVRPLRADELKHYEQNKDQYLPPIQHAVTLRIASKNIEADRPLLREHLMEIEKTKPDSLSVRLLPNMRAVNLTVPKEQSAGGLIQTGEWVDVFLTTTITVDGVSSTRTAAIAHKQRIIAKRNSLWPVFAALPEDKPVHFTLEMNPYRAALVEYCKAKGMLTMMPVSSSEQKSLEERRVAAMNGKDVVPVVFVSQKGEAGAEYQGEDDRVDAINKGELNIGTQDLVRIFNIQSKAPPTPVVTTPPEKPITVQQYNSRGRIDSAMFNKDGSLYENSANRYQSWVEEYNQRAPVAPPKPIAAPVAPAAVRPGARTSNANDLGNTPDIQFSAPDCSASAPKRKG